MNEKANLAKILWYYNLIPDVNSSIQKIVCPFHKDINPSMLVNLENNSWFCFGCQKSGDDLEFVRLMEDDLSELSACGKMIKILRSKKSSDLKIRRFTNKRKKKSKSLYDESYDYYKGLRTCDWESPVLDDEEKIKDYMRLRGFTARALNLAKAKATFNFSYPIIFPMLDNGKFKGWVCRTTSKKIEEKRKYLYNEGFSRATTLVGDYGKKEYVYIVEGYMDRLKFLQFGENNVVAILGWKITDEQIKKLKNAGVKKIISALDNDEYGRKGTTYLKHFFEVERIIYPENVKDPGDFSRKQFVNLKRRRVK